MVCLPGAVASVVSPATATATATAPAGTPAAICTMKLMCQTVSLRHNTVEHSCCHAWNALHVQGIHQVRAGLAQTTRTGTLQYQTFKAWLNS